MRNISLVILIFLFFFISTTYADIFLGVPERPKKEAETAPSRAWKARLDEAKKAYLGGNYKACIDEVERLLSLNPPVEIKPDMRYLLGLALMQDGRCPDARANFSIILSERSRDALLEDTYLSVADSYYLEGNFDEAYSRYRKFLLDYPDSDYSSGANLKLGLCARKKGRWDEAGYYFQKVQAEYPLSIEAKQAAELLNQSETYFSVQVGSFQNKDNALALEEVLKQKGYDAYIMAPKDKGDSFYRVRAGRFSSKVEAEFTEGKLKREGFPTKVFP